MTIITTTTTTVVAQARRLHQRLHIHGGEHRGCVKPTGHQPRPRTLLHHQRPDPLRRPSTITFPSRNMTTFGSPQLPLPLHPRLSQPSIITPASPPPQDAMRTDAASTEPLEAHNATERNTKKPKLRNAETAQIRHDLPEDWVSKSRGAKKYWLQSHK
jgi:hypothetical protein